MIKEYLIQAISFVGFLGGLVVVCIVLEKITMIMIGVLGGAYKKEKKTFK